MGGLDRGKAQTTRQGIAGLQIVSLYIQAEVEVVYKISGRSLRSAVCGFLMRANWFFP